MMLKMIMMMTMRRMTMLKMIKKEMTMRNMMMSSDAPGSSDAGTQRAKDGGEEGWRRPEQDKMISIFIAINLMIIMRRRESTLLSEMSE